MSNQRKYVANAFVRCSLRKEDQPFVEYITRILDVHNIRSTGTVGKFNASPENPVELMKKNIPDADMLVICATPRYFQSDLTTGKVTYGLSEMIHVETGIALAHNKPVVVFAKEGTDLGSCLPNITQYIVLNGDENNYLENQHLIYSLLHSSYKFIQNMRSSKELKTAETLATAILAIYGGIKLLQYLFKK
jgi:hypothetical protein